MRMSSFMLGGLLGAMAAMYATRRRPELMARACNAMTDAGAAMAGKAMSMWLNADRKKAAAEAPKPADDTAERSGVAWEQIEAIISSDPAVKKEVDKIKAASSGITH
ncbi:hypothetical protein [Paenibacillus chungangensis]|uniref:YtxH domain-containing protein n=1 Tax=Paenibacillus chungangensis TaxID=696535 RepID=A0ABW3HMN7_9BACL